MLLVSLQQLFLVLPQPFNTAMISPQHVLSVQRCCLRLSQRVILLSALRRHPPQPRRCSCVALLVLTHVLCCGCAHSRSQHHSSVLSFHNSIHIKPHPFHNLTTTLSGLANEWTLFIIFFVFVPLVQLPFVTLKKHSIILFTTAPQQVFSAAAHQPRSTLPLPHTLPQLHHSHYILPTTLHHHVPYHSCTIILLVPLHL